MINGTPNYFFYGLLFAVLTLAVLMFLPFLTPIVLAAALSVVFGPLHRKVQAKLFKDRERSSLAAFLTLIIIAAIVLVPALLIVGKIYSEIQTMYGYLIDEGGRSEFISTLNSFSDVLTLKIYSIYPDYSFDSFNITAILQKGLEWAFANLDRVFTSVALLAFNGFVMLLALFYFLRDGRELKRQIIALSPLGDADDEKIMRKMQRAIYAIFAGSIFVGIIQGILVGLGFWIFGVPSPALWGFVAAIAALIPGVGTSLVIIPGIAYLLLTGMTNPAIGLLIWGLLAVGLIDNFLGPIFMNRTMKVHPFMVLVSVLGGLSFFGPIGFVLGPIILAFLFSLLEIYRTATGRKTE
ncbi:MAG: AI-2E family transporter [Candidatus Pacebacteria bacterium]|nr:AI-2E family transporter [Candidatus Paceibacterota bacterium]